MKQLLFILLFFPLAGISQSPLNSWIGEYSGDMILGNVNRPNDTIPVEFTMDVIQPDSAWSYKMVFKSEKYGRIEKDYLFKATSVGDTVNFILDEQNGILMELSYMNGCLYGMYDVLNNTYISTMRRTEKGLHFELISSPAKPTFNSMADAEVSEEPILVESFKPILHQTVHLIKNE